MCVCACAYVCACACACYCARAHAHVCTYMHTYIHTYSRRAAVRRVQGARAGTAVPVPAAPVRHPHAVGLPWRGTLSRRRAVDTWAPPPARPPPPPRRSLDPSVPLDSPPVPPSAFAGFRTLCPAGTTSIRPRRTSSSTTTTGTARGTRGVLTAYSWGQPAVVPPQGGRAKVLRARRWRRGGAVAPCPPTGASYVCAVCDASV
jgi:hypothetical protein